MTRSLQLPLESWLRKVLRIVNDPGKPNHVVSRLRERLEQLIGDTLPGRNGFLSGFPLPPLLITVSKQRGVRLGAEHWGPWTKDQVGE